MAYLTDEFGNRFLENGSQLVDSVPHTRLGYGGYGVQRAGIFGGKGATAHPEAKITRLSLDGYGVRRYGSFAGKSSGGGSHPVGIITRLSLDGYGVRRYGSFAGKASAATHPVGLLTRLGLDGYGVRRYRTFANKTPSVVIVPPIVVPPVGAPAFPSHPYYGRGKELKHRILSKIVGELESGVVPKVKAKDLGNDKETKAFLKELRRVQRLEAEGERLKALQSALQDAYRIRADLERRMFIDDEDAILAILLSD